MKVSDYIINFFQKNKINFITLNNGGAISFLADEISKSQKFNIFSPVHEQSAAIINDSITRISNIPSVSLVTSGPGATNLITGIACSWFDSIPSIFITGQVNTYEMKKKNENVRQVGFQETNILDLCKSITKFAFQIKKADQIVKVLPKALSLATKGRKGPVLIDIPLNLQRAELNSNNIIIYSKKKNASKKQNFNIDKAKIKILTNLISLKKKPIVLLGHGVRIANASSVVRKFLDHIQIPVLTTWGGKDCFDNFNKNYFGSVGVYGNRYSNLILQNCDLLISLGTRLDTRVTGGNFREFCKQAKIVTVDIDKSEIQKIRKPKSILNFNCDVKDFANSFLKQRFKIKDFSRWKLCCEYIKQNLKEPVQKTKLTSPEFFFKKLNKFNKKINYYFADTGAHLCWAAQGLNVTSKQRFITSFGHSTMGYALPGAIGASLYNPSSCIISINGDCSFQLNIQELALIKNLKTNIKFFVLNNSGYGIIRQFQDNYLNSRYFGTCEYIANIDLEKISKGFSLPYYSIKKNDNIDKILNKIFNSKKSSITEIFIKKNHKIFPKIQFGNNLESMTPKLKIDFKKIIQNFKNDLTKL